MSVPILVLGFISACSQSWSTDPAAGEPVEMADVMTGGLTFERGMLRGGALPATTDRSFGGLPGEPLELALQPGSSGSFEFEVAGDSSEVVATLLQVEGADDYIEVRLDGRRNGRIAFRVRDAICRLLCSKHHELSLIQTFRSRDGRIGRHVRALRLLLDCTERGDRERCDEDGPGGVGGTGGSAGMSGSGGMGGSGGMSGSGGMNGGVGGGSGVGGSDGQCTNAGEDDITCPDAVGPFVGSCAPKGECCRRASNTAKIAELGVSEPQVLEYRVSSALPINQPLSLSLPILRMAAAERARTCAGDQCQLLRFTQPREGGEPVAGPGVSEIGIGRYNCDGTYSFYDSVVAPDRPTEGLTDPARWATPAADTTIDPALDGVARTRTAWATNPNQRISCAPFFLPGTQSIDWEQCTTGFEILELDTSAAGLDCQGAWSGFDWQAPGRAQSFVPLAANSHDIIDAISQNLCQLLSFSVLPPEERDTDCLAIPRCMPNSEGCKYVKLPDSLCPESDEERSIFRCHLGATDNPNQEEGYPSSLNCTANAPTTALDPDSNPSVSAGQCCDPLGDPDSALPACNAFRIVYEFAAGAAEITDSRSSDFPPVCY